jgi:hypothetical protein
VVSSIKAYRELRAPWIERLSRRGQPFNPHSRRHHGDALVLLVPDLDNHLMASSIALARPIHSKFGGRECRSVFGNGEAVELKRLRPDNEVHPVMHVEGTVNLTG